MSPLDHIETELKKFLPGKGEKFIKTVAKAVYGALVRHYWYAGKLESWKKRYGGRQAGL